MECGGRETAGRSRTEITLELIGHCDIASVNPGINARHFRDQRAKQAARQNIEQQGTQKTVGNTIPGGIGRSFSGVPS